MKLHRYVDHQRLHIVTKDVISLSISVLLLFRHYISHKITFGAPSSGGVLCSACGAFIPSAMAKSSFYRRPSSEHVPTRLECTLIFTHRFCHYPGSKLIISIFLKFSEYFLVCEFFCVNNFGGHRFLWVILRSY